MLHRHRRRVLLGVVLAVSLSVVSTAGIAIAEQCRFSRIAFSSARDNPPPADPRLFAEIYLMDPDGTNPRRLTENTGGGNSHAAVSPDGKKIVFDSNRLRTDVEPLLTADLFLMDTDGTQQTLLIRGSSATWSPDSKHIAFHRSASGDVCTVSDPLNVPPTYTLGCPIKVEPGAATWDSDIFVMNVDDLLPQNLTNSPDDIDDDPDWSPDGQRIVFTSHTVLDNQTNSVTAEIYVMNADGTGRVALTDNAEEERAPTWSPKGTRILYMCRKGSNAQGTPNTTFELCVMNADGTGQTRLTTNTVLDATPSWSPPDGEQIVFHRPGAISNEGLQLWVMNADGTGQVQLTHPPGLNLYPKWAETREPCEGDESN